MLPDLQTRFQVLVWTIIFGILVVVLSILMAYAIHVSIDMKIGRAGMLTSALVPAIIAPIVIYHLLNLIRQLQITRGKLESISREDYLTGIYNRRYVEEIASQEFSLSKRHGFPVSILLLDLDYFKKINDTYGHGVGDFALVELTRCIQNIIRKTDVFGRYGGEEFILFMPHTTLEHASQLAERILQAIAGHTFSTSGANLNITASIGVATNTLESKTLDDLILYADRALYRAKANGRNRTEIHMPAQQSDASPSDTNRPAG